MTNWKGQLDLLFFLLLVESATLLFSLLYLLLGRFFEMFSLADANNHHFTLLQKCLNLLPDPITAFPFTDEPPQLIL